MPLVVRGIVPAATRRTSATETPWRSDTAARIASMNGALFGVAGDWEVKVTARVSEFDAYFATMKVGIE